MIGAFESFFPGVDSEVFGFIVEAGVSALSKELNLPWQLCTLLS